MPDDKLTVALNKIEARAAASHADDVPQLLDAIGAVLALSDRLAAGYPGERPGPGVTATKACGRAIRETISRALLGEDGTDGT